MDDKDYKEILQFTRELMRNRGFAAVDERILSDMRGSEGAYWDLTYYLKHLVEEIALGSDRQLVNVLRRYRENVRVEAGGPIVGIRVEMSEEDRKRFDRQYFDFEPNHELGEIAEDLKLLIHELHNYRENSKGKNESEND